MIKTYQHFVFILITLASFSCSEETELPTVQFEQRAVVSATSASLLFDSQHNLFQFDEVGYLVGESEELMFDEAKKVVFDKGSGDSQYAIVEDLAPGQTYFFSFYTVVGGAVKMYEAISFTTHKKGTWAKRTIYPQHEDMGSGYHIFKAGNNFYFGGGTNRSDRYVGDLYEYSPNLDRWIKKNNIPQNMYGAEFTSGTETSEGKAIVLTDNNSLQANFAYLYDSNTDSWNPISTISDTLHFEPIFSSNLFTIDQQAYLVGYSQIKVTGRSNYEVYRYDEAGAFWKLVTKHTGMEMYYPKVAEVDGQVYVASRSIRNEIHRIDLASGSTTANYLAVPTEKAFISDIARWKNGLVVNQGQITFYYDIEGTNLDRVATK